MEVMPHDPRGMLDMLIGLGLNEIDAWHCLHHMQGRASLVLVQVGGARDGFAPFPVGAGAFPELTPEEVGAAFECGAAWTRLGGGGWRYLRRLGWSRSDLAELQEDLAGLSTGSGS
jgi:hypothetical protein